MKKLIITLCVTLGLMSQSAFSLYYTATITNMNVPLFFSSWKAVGSTGVIAVSSSDTRNMTYPLSTGASDSFSVNVTPSSSNEAWFYYLTPTTGNKTCTGENVDEDDCAGCVVKFSCIGSADGTTCQQLTATAVNYGTSTSVVCGAPTQKLNSSSLSYTMS